MAEIRVVIAIVLFSISSYLIYDLIANSFDWFVLVAVITGYLLVHLIWPKHAENESAWYDVLELIFDLPYRLIVLFFRSIAKILRGGDGDIGIDL